MPGSAKGRRVSKEFRRTYSVCRTIDSPNCVSESKRTTRRLESPLPRFKGIHVCAAGKLFIFEEHSLRDPDTNTGTPTTEISGPHNLQVILDNKPKANIGSRLVAILKRPWHIPGGLRLALILDWQPGPVCKKNFDPFQERSGLRPLSP